MLRPGYRHRSAVDRPWGFAVIVDAAWIVFLGYEFFRFVEFVF